MSILISWNEINAKSLNKKRVVNYSKMLVCVHLSSLKMHHLKITLEHLIEHTSFWSQFRSVWSQMSTVVQLIWIPLIITSNMMLFWSALKMQICHTFYAKEVKQDKAKQKKKWCNGSFVPSCPFVFCGIDKQGHKNISQNLQNNLHLSTVAGL